MKSCKTEKINKKVKNIKRAAYIKYPQTNAAVVYNDEGEALGGVEAGAQVNVIESISVNGTALEITDKTAAIEIAEGAEYLIEKAATAEDGYSASYQLTKDGTAVGDLINIPKDLVVESGTVETVETADSPVEGYAVGDKYIDLVLANSDDQHIYILVSDLVDTYTAGTGIAISSNVISVDTSAFNYAESATTLEGYGITDAYTKTEVDELLASGISYETIDEE